MTTAQAHFNEMQTLGLNGELFGGINLCQYSKP